MVYPLMLARGDNKKGIILGASSGIGPNLARILFMNNYAGLAVRRVPLLENLQVDIEWNSMRVKNNVMEDVIQPKK
ncbi:MAG TPA: hypothetical protein VF857_03820 [Spirochaetota bacterium]